MSPITIESQREALHNILSNIDGVAKAYYQPPSSQRLEYPCILYELANFDSRYSNNKRYLTFPSFTVTLIDRNPESSIQKSIMDLDDDCHISFDRFYTADNMNHWVYKLVFSKSLW